MTKPRSFVTKVGTPAQTQKLRREKIELCVLRGTANQANLAKLANLRGRTVGPWTVGR